MTDTVKVRVKVEQIYPDPTQWKRYGIKAGSNLYLVVYLPVEDVIENYGNYEYDLTVNGIKIITRALAEISLELEAQRRKQVQEEDYNAYT